MCAAHDRQALQTVLGVHMGSWPVCVQSLGVCGHRWTSSCLTNMGRTWCSTPSPMADLILRLPFLSVVSANDVKHMQTVLVWWGSGAGVRVERECEANRECGACEWDLSRDIEPEPPWTHRLFYIVLVDRVCGFLGTWGRGSNCWE